MAYDDAYYNDAAVDDDANNNNVNNNNNNNSNSNNSNYISDEDFWDSEEGINKYFMIFFSLLSLVLVLSKLLHDHPKLSAVLPEAGMTIIVGTIAGAVIFISTPVSDNDDGDDDSLFNGNVNQFVAEGLLSFSPTIFFFILLPPIIFNSGYNLKRDLFFRHIAPISLFACIGTAISTFVVAVMLQIVKDLGWTGDFKPHFTELLTFGSLISATDPVSTLAVFQAKQVDPQLFYLVFGESVLNDAVGLVLFKTLSKFVGKQDNVEKIFGAIVEFLLDFSVGFIGSMILGFGAGLCSGFFLKKVDMRSTPLLELSLFFLIMYMPFFFAELFELSGIVTILFTGIFARRYATVNLSEGTEEHVDMIFRLSAHIAETSIFLELGLSVFGMGATFKWKFVGWAILACLIGRALNIYPLRSLYNMFLLRTLTDGNNGSDRSLQMAPSVLSSVSLTPNIRKDLKVRNKTAHMLWFSGLRGAVAYACAKTFPNAYENKDNFVSTTMAIVFFTVFIFGCTTEWALKALDIEMFCDEEKYMEENKTGAKMNFINIFGKWRSEVELKNNVTDILVFIFTSIEIEINIQKVTNVLIHYLFFCFIFFFIYKQKTNIFILMLLGTIPIKVVKMLWKCTTCQL
jgi:sodium/hydrogen exchanger 8